jgi:hypothetical protein
MLIDVPVLQESTIFSATRASLDIRANYKRITQCLYCTNIEYVKWYNRCYINKRFAEGDLVIMSAKYLRLKCRSCKLVDKYLGPFCVLEMIDNYGFTYKLDLPIIYCVYNVVSIAVLKLFRPRKGKALKP